MEETLKEEIEGVVVRWYPPIARNFATIKVQLHPYQSGFFARLATAWRMLTSATAYIDLDRNTMHQLAARYNVEKAINTDDDAKAFFQDPHGAEQAASQAGL